MSYELLFILYMLALGFSSIISLFMALKDRRKILLFFLIPIIVLCSIGAYNNIHSLLGLSRPDYLPKKEVLILQAVIEKKDYIYIWYLDEEVNQPRAIKIPYSEQNKIAIQSIMDEIKQGQNPLAKFSAGKDGNSPYGVTVHKYNFENDPQSKKIR